MSQRRLHNFTPLASDIPGILAHLRVLTEELSRRSRRGL
jgi:hypothetical protein